MKQTFENTIAILKGVKEGYANLYDKKPWIEELAKARAPICAACPHFYLNKQGKQKCTFCPCNMSAKMRSPSSYCSRKIDDKVASLWEEVDKAWKEKHWIPGTNQIKPEFLR